MSIVTKTGDSGTTALLFQRRVPKSHPAIAACGDIDELNAALGLARAQSLPPNLAELLLTIQQHLIPIMGELATLPHDHPQYIKNGFAPLTPLQTAALDQAVAQFEPQITPAHGWAIPGTHPASASLDFARTVCRRAERSACALHQTQPLTNPQILVYLNRLSDLLWILARWSDQHPHP